MAEIEQMRADLEGHKKANAQLKEDLQLKSEACERLQARLKEWQERAVQLQGETIRSSREKADLERSLLRAHRMLIGHLDVLFPEPDADVEQLKARLLQDVQDYLAVSGLQSLFDLLEEGETLTLEHGGRAMLCGHGEVVAIGNATVEALLFSRSHEEGGADEVTIEC